MKKTRTINIINIEKDLRDRAYCQTRLTILYKSGVKHIFILGHDSHKERDEMVTKLYKSLQNDKRDILIDNRGKIETANILIFDIERFSGVVE